ncbi:hypothetical protein BJ508DRAFT_336113 [Ascobolus immersus RN42]|uniref:Uncharacterized protein n=1 Tax=Ascobolus immersus RN42 TaxID=1160509 RepID=A0A3N4HDN9_ASCIM|nr:hypothetical protein BJ508DRAFT_336113 [Ascobolus immersus RN42]
MADVDPQLRDRIESVINRLLEAQTLKEFSKNTLKECSVDGCVEPRERAVFHYRVNFLLKEAIDKVIAENRSCGAIPSHDISRVLQLEAYYQGVRDDYDRKYQDRVGERQELIRIATNMLEQEETKIRRCKEELRVLLRLAGIAV